MVKHTYFPIFKNASTMRVCVIGNGRLARHRIKGLCDFSDEIHITVVCRELGAELEPLFLEGRIDFFRIEGDFPTEDELESACLVIWPNLAIIADADNDKTAVTYDFFIKRGVEVNSPDKPNYCTVIFPSIVKGENYTAALSTHGNAPGAAAELARRVSSALPKGLDGIIEWISEMRARVYADGSIDAQARKQTVMGLTRAALDKGAPLTPDEEKLILNYLTEPIE